MTIIFSQLKKISTFIYILVFLLGFNLFFNLNYDWYGISLIVRVYLFVFSFYLIFNYSSLDIERLGEIYFNRFGRWGELLLFLETRAAPFIFIYIVTIVFTLIDYVRFPHWPWNPVLSILNGRYSNLIIYSIFLLLILKTRKGPGWKIVIFLGSSVAYFFIDKVLHSLFPMGASVSVIKVIKFHVLFFLMLLEFYSYKRVYLKAFVVSLAGALTAFAFIMSVYYSIYRFSGGHVYPQKEAGLVLLNCGFRGPLKNLERLVVRHQDPGLFSQLLVYVKRYNYEFGYSAGDWERLLFSGRVSMADTVAGYILDKEIFLSYDKIVTFAQSKSADPREKIENASDFILLAAQYLKGNEGDLKARIASSNRSFQLWGIAVLGEQRNTDSVPFLLEFLPGMDLTLAESAYESLKKITNLDPAARLNSRINDPEVLWQFKEFYLRTRRVK